MDENEFTTLRISQDQRQYLESIKLTEGEYLNSVLQRVIDKAKAFDKRVKA